MSTMTKIPRTAGTDLAWRQGNTANMIGNPSSANPYEPQLSNDAYRAWNQGYHGHPYDERGGFARKEDS